VFRVFRDAVRAVRYFVTRPVSAPRAVRAVRAVCAVRCFVTPIFSDLVKSTVCSGAAHVCAFFADSFIVYCDLTDMFTNECNCCIFLAVFCL